jgi:glycosyltransferase involved in cell wall biosynthesis
MTEPIRVAQIVTRFIAGAGGVALRGALALDPDRYAVTVLSGQGDRLADEARAAGMGYIALRSLRPELRPDGDLAAYAELLGHLRTGRFDVVHTHSAKAGAIGRIAARRVGVPAIVHTFHGFPFHEFQSRPRRTAYIALERRLGRLTHRFLAVGTDVAAQAIRLRIAGAERIVSIPSSANHVIPAADATSKRAARRAIGVPPGMKVVGTVGRLDYQKAPEVFVRALAHLQRPDVFGVWVGGGPLRAQVEEATGRLGLTQHMAWLGERSDVAALLPAFDVFAMASRYEGLPCAVLEAMACGVPVVATAVNAVPEVVVPGRTGLLVPPEDARALAGALDHLLHHPDFGRRLATEARREALGERFSPEVLGRVVADTYASLVGEDAAGAAVGQLGARGRRTATSGSKARMPAYAPAGGGGG